MYPPATHSPRYPVTHSPMKLLTPLFLLTVLLSGCRGATPAAAPVTPVAPAPETPPLPSATPTRVPPTETPLPTATSRPSLPETPVTLLPLDGPAAARKAEYSGMAWYGDNLILLPQYPDRFAAQAEGVDGAVFTLPKDAILSALEADPVPPLAPQALPVEWGDLPRQVRGFEGFEAIVFDGDTVYLTIEASPGGRMKGYLVRGSIAPDLSLLRVDAATLTEIPLPADIANKSDEALLLLPGGNVAAFYEVNGAQLNPDPAASVFSPALEMLASLPFPRLEYRFTDVTALDGEGVFWGINYFYPGDVEQRTDDDPLAARYGVGETHAQNDAVERLVALRWTDEGATLLDTPPLYLQLLPDGEARNWEGLVRLDNRGFLLVTDKYPETLLGFVRVGR